MPQTHQTVFSRGVESSRGVQSLVVKVTRAIRMDNKLSGSMSSVVAVLCRFSHFPGATKSDIREGSGPSLLKGVPTASPVAWRCPLEVVAAQPLLVVTLQGVLCHLFSG